MTSNKVSPSSNKTKELLNRLMILEKFIELKTNECAYYRSKVHLMQMSAFNNLQIIKTSSPKQNYKNTKRSSSEDLSCHSSTKSCKHRRNSLPLALQQRALLKRHLNISHLSDSSILFDQSNKSKHLPFTFSLRRHRKKTNDKSYAKNQNYHERSFPRSNEKLFSSTNHPDPSIFSNDRNLINEIILAYFNKHLQQAIVHDKNIQCNAIDLNPGEMSSKSRSTSLKIRLSHRLIKSLLEKQLKTKKSKLKVQISSQLLEKLFRSAYLNPIRSKRNSHRLNQFTTQSQFSRIVACIDRKSSTDIQQSEVVHAKAEMKTHREHYLPTIRHIARTKSNGSYRKKNIAEKNLQISSQHYQQKEKHFDESNSTSDEKISSKRNSLTNITQSIVETLSSSSQTK